jgi:hypothetical protein
MEKFTNSTSVLVESAQNELLDFPKNIDNQIVITYAEFPHFQNAFAVHLQMEKNGQILLVKKIWDKLFDLQRFPLGLYNLDRLKIVENEFRLNEIQKEDFLEIIQQLKSVDLPQKLEDEGWIVLDGVEYLLDIQLLSIHQKYTWRIANKNIEVFQSLISFLKAQTQS